MPFGARAIVFANKAQKLLLPAINIIQQIIIQDESLATQVSWPLFNLIRVARIAIVRLNGADAGQSGHH